MYAPGFSKVSVPEGSAGEWTVERFRVTAAEARLHNLRCAMNPRRYGMHPEIKAGRYTRLMCGGEIAMSDTPAESWDHLSALERMRGDVLITGLGLGFVIRAALAKPAVRSVTVIERSPDVIALVEGSLARNKPPALEIQCADAFGWKPLPRQRFDYVWHDIWFTICADNLPEMTKLKRRYAHWCRAQGCWSESDLRSGY